MIEATPSLKVFSDVSFFLFSCSCAVPGFDQRWSRSRRPLAVPLRARQRPCLACTRLVAKTTTPNTILASVRLWLPPIGPHYRDQLHAWAGEHLSATSCWNDQTLSWFDHCDGNVWGETAGGIDVERWVFVAFEYEAVADGAGREGVVLRDCQLRFQDGS